MDGFSLGVWRPRKQHCCLNSVETIFCSCQIAALASTQAYLSPDHIPQVRQTAMMLSKYLPGRQVLPCRQISAAGFAGVQLGPICQQPEQAIWQTGCKRRRLCLQASLSQRGAETGEVLLHGW